MPNIPKTEKAPDQNNQIAELHAMASALSGQQSSLRMAAMMSGGYDFADTLHNIYMDYGYPATLTFSHFWNMYRRFGVARNVVELPVDTGWITPPVIEGGEAFLREIEALDKKVDLWSRLRGLDKRQRVGRYAGMFMRVRDDKNPREPIDSKLNGVGSLVEMMPLYESQLEVTSTDNDPKSDTFGQPILVQYSQSAPGSRNEEAKSTITIHSSRIVFTAEGADTGWIYGIPALEPVFNSLMDLRKIIGGGGEGFYKNAAQSIIFDLKDAASAEAYKAKLEDFNDKYDDFARNRARRSMWTPGMQTSVLSSNLISPKDFAEAALNDIAAGSQIPATILIGQQTGRLASSEDSRHFLSVCQSRRENYQSSLVQGVLNWLIKWGVLRDAEYSVKWDDLLARSDKERLENATDMSTINKNQFGSGGQVPFSGDEIREAAGFEAEPEENPGTEEIDDS